MRMLRANISTITACASRHAVAFLLIMLSACAVPHDRSTGDNWGQARLEGKSANDPVRLCADAFSAIDLAINQAGTGDAQSASVPGFPYLRSTRFLAALGKRVPAKRDDGAFEYWTNWLAQTAISARKIELANLPIGTQDALRRGLGKSPEAVIVDCTAVLLASDRRRPDLQETLAGVVSAPDNYIDAFRVIGLYPVTSIPVLIGFERWKASNLPEFAQSPAKLKLSGRLEFVSPEIETPSMEAEPVAAILRRVADNPLNIPRPMKSDLHRLAAKFAPVFAIDVVGNFDRIGAPVLRYGRPPGIDTGTPRVYVQPSWAIINGVPLLQISYLAWFSERPPVGGVDILAGKLDGLIWRVTIGSDGRPVMYDSIHPCGCYHLFFPVPPTRLKAHQVDEPAEGTVVPRDAPILASGQRMVLHINSGNHYLRGLSVFDDKTVRPILYDLLPMDSLRSLPAPDGSRRSLYGPDGLIAGSERAERWLLWPMGVRSPGAMRQWGTHATAFVGRRHFDDPYVIDKAFAR